MVSEVIDAGLTSRIDMARRFQVSIPSVDRWVEGKSRPHRIIRERVEAWIGAGCPD